MGYGPGDGQTHVKYYLPTTSFPFTTKFSFSVKCIIFSVRDPVAFSTRLDENTSINDSPVIFETVDLNIGDGYDEFTGKFVTNNSVMAQFMKF